MSEPTHIKKNKPVIGISIGDYNGIGPEVIIKAIEDNRIQKYITPVVYCDSRIISHYRKLLDLPNFNYHQIKSIDQVHHNRFNLVNVQIDGEIAIQPGHGHAESGKYALKSLKVALEDLKAKKIDGLCTAPLSKELVQSDDFKFPGHTEYLTIEAGAKESLMLLVSDELKVGVVTGHIPIKDVSAALTKEKVKSKLQILQKSLKKDFGIKKPRIAVLGLNPHAGENGLLGTEEIEVISPIINEMKENGHLVFGPFPADGFFGSSQFKSFDGILAMYHDQGLIPFKNMAFESGVNFTAGLSFIRTSPDHGTAFSIAGKCAADATSMRNALFLARDIVNSRDSNEG
ncbi:MAG: 4-hydroxythreonine-4-phosphate dehydrogenase [Cyclobacteriaceae bacterium]|jgi:4-hydroxythreonine-4-phosphate dehydrogenase